MTFHPLVLAYGRRRGYAMTDLNRIFSPEQSSLFSSLSTPSANESTDVLLAHDLTLNLADPSIYLNEVRLFASFFNSLPVITRRQLRPYADGIISFFTRKLLQFGNSPEALSPAVQEFQFPEGPAIIDAGAKEIRDQSSEVQLQLKKFLSEFRTPLLQDYFRSETPLFAFSMKKEAGREELRSDSVYFELIEKELDSENEDDNVDEPTWWKKDALSTLEENVSDTPQSTDIDSILDEIRDISSKLSAKESIDSSFPLSMKLYNLSSNFRGTNDRSRAAAICADLTIDGRLACFGCDGDSSIICFPLRHTETSSSIAKSSTLRVSSASGIVYRIGILDSRIDDPVLIATTDDPSRPVQLFELASGTKIYDYRGHQWPVWALDVSQREGGLFVTGSYDRTARLFLLDRSDPVRIFAGHESSVDCVLLIDGLGGPAADGNVGYTTFTATASADGTVRIWSLTDAIPVRVFHGVKGWPTALAYRSTANGGSEKLLACATTEGKIFIWDLETSRQYQILDNVLANDLQFSPDGQYLAAGGDVGCFKIYHLSSGSGEFGNQYAEIQISEDLLFHNMEAKFLRVRFLQKEIICLTA